MFKIIVSMWVALVWVLPPSAQTPLFNAAPSSPVAVGNSPGQIVWADVNGDGRLDLVTRHLLEKFIAVHLGDGAGRFAAAPGSPLALKTEPGAVEVADLNGDKLTDLVVTHSDRDSVDIFFGDGQGGFKLAPNSPVKVSADETYYTRSLNLIDLNEDGQLDIVTANHRRTTLATLLGNGRGEFSPGPTITIPADAVTFSFSHGDLFGDLDGDKHLDLLIVSREQDEVMLKPGRVRILRGDGKGTFKGDAASALTIPAGPVFVKLADMNNDQRLDIVTSHNINRLSVLLNNGGTFTPAAGSPYVLNATPYGVSVADVNRDQRLDIVAATVESVTILLGDKDGYKPAPGSPFLAGPGAYSVTLADINKDGKLDIAASSFESKAVTLLLGR
jgi:hypothetical protein